MKIVFELSEYVVPKLARTELNGKFSNDSLPEDLSILSTDELVKRAEASRAIEQNRK